MPRFLHPGLIVRHRALYRGVLGPSKWWKAVAVVVFGRGLLRRVFGTHPDMLGTEKLQAGQTVMITSIAALTRSERKDAKRARRRRQRRLAAANASAGTQSSGRTDVG